MNSPLIALELQTLMCVMDVGTIHYLNLIKEIGIGVLNIKVQIDNLNVIDPLQQLM
jgi:hypothetical protein